ncbi:MAG: hypothetical protein WCO98_12425 [bacterium]
MKKYIRPLQWHEIGLILFALWAVIALVAPLFNHRSDMPKRDTACTSNLRQLAMAAEMYSQDNKNRLPGLYKRQADNTVSTNYTGWVSDVDTYAKGGADVIIDDMFHCPDIDKNMKKYVSYGYNAALLLPNGAGIDKKIITIPAKVGLLCDSEPMLNIELQGGIIGSYKNNLKSQLSVKPVGRHKGHVVVGYADGHSAAVSENYDENDKENVVNKAFYRADELGYIKKDAKGK